MYRGLLSCLISVGLFCSCSENLQQEGVMQMVEKIPPATPELTITEVTQTLQSNKAKAASAEEILAKTQVPILCYHQIRDWKASDSKSARDYIIPVQRFKEHLQLFADSGYNSVLPHQVYDYLVYGTPLPPKPFMLTFDDTSIDHYLQAWPEMKKHGFKGVFFIMTVSINRAPNYMSSEQIKTLANEGNVIGLHTWNHERVTGYKTVKDWETQLEKPKKRLEEITGKPVEYFAYPFGLWNAAAIPELKSRDVKAAFILSTSRDSTSPLYTIRRIIASGYWSAPSLHQRMINTFAAGK